VTPSDRESRLLAAVSLLTDTLAEDYDVIDLLQVLVDTMIEVLEVDAAGVLLADPVSGALDLVASTDDSTRFVEAMRLGAVDGPYVEAFREARTVSIADVETLSERFQEFHDSAVAKGFRSVHALPMRLRNRTIGAVSLFRSEVGELDAGDQRAARALTDVTTVGILHERSFRASELLRRQLEHALDSRVVIEQAKGVLAQTHAISMNEAFRRIRDRSRSERAPIAEVAQRIVDRAGDR
jgi:GAF domain-containing protein